jgi:hypothetical protein
MMDDGGRRIEDRGQKTEDRGRMVEKGGQRRHQNIRTSGDAGHSSVDIVDIKSWYVARGS